MSDCGISWSNSLVFLPLYLLEYKGPKTFGVTDYTNQAPKKVLQMYRMDTLLELHFAKVTHVITLSWLASNFCGQLITFSNNLDPDQDQHSGIIWTQTVCHSDGVPERIFGKVKFESMINYPACKELKKNI